MKQMFSTLLTSSNKKETHLYTHTHKLIQCTVILFQQKDVWSQGWQNMLLFCLTEDQCTLSTPDNNIVKVYFKLCDTWHILVQKEKVLVLKEWLSIHVLSFFFSTERSLFPNGRRAYSVNSWQQHRQGIFEVLWHVTRTRYRPIRKYASL